MLATEYGYLDLPLTLAEHNRQYVSRATTKSMQANLGQFFTQAPVAEFMAGLFTNLEGKYIRLLDAGAGIGSLTAAFVQRAVLSGAPPAEIDVTLFEVDTSLSSNLRLVLASCASLCKRYGVSFRSTIHEADFILESVNELDAPLLSSATLYTHAILNPPYGKITTDSIHRQALHRIGIETTNLYSAFLWLASELLEPQGQLAAITPRSFCNGSYFLPFRKQLFTTTSLTLLHVFDRRDSAFADDDVLQENIILHVEKAKQQKEVTVSSSEGAFDIDMPSRRTVGVEAIVHSDDPARIIHIPVDRVSQDTGRQLSLFGCKLDDLGVSVSTGRVVQFRSGAELRQEAEKDTVPLIHPMHFESGMVRWPKPKSRKPNAILHTSENGALFLPNETYVLVKRFSSKEERRRVVAAIYQPNDIDAPLVGFENHLNVFHLGNRGLPLKLAKGLAVYLNSTLVDSYFRQFSGHTQVNSSDLRSLWYPNRATLERFGELVGLTYPTQSSIDELVSSEVAALSELPITDVAIVKRKIEEARRALSELGLPRPQINERSALTLLALLSIQPETEWAEAKNALWGITPIMEFMSKYYGRDYAPNTRETVRRQTMHQFVQAGLVVENPDQPDRPVNSPHWCYQIEPSALHLLHNFDSDAWANMLAEYHVALPTLRERYLQARYITRIPIILGNGAELVLSPGRHNELGKAILNDFAATFARGADVVYVGDTKKKWAYKDQSLFDVLGLALESHGKMPDVVLYDRGNDWVYVIEAVTSHGPISPKRKIELQALFASVRARLVYVTAFLTRQMLAKYLVDISWETEVWVAEDPSHLIHFDGERFLGPYASVD